MLPQMQSSSKHSFLPFITLWVHRALLGQQGMGIADSSAFSWEGRAGECAGRCIVCKIPTLGIPGFRQEKDIKMKSYRAANCTP